MDQEHDDGPEPAPGTGSIGRKAGRGFRWSLAGNLVMRAGSFAMGLVLARLLAPGDFGIYAVALAATQFVMTIKDIGIIAATVQWRGELKEMAPTASVMAMASAILLYVVFWVGAPSFAAMAGSAEAAPVVRLLTAVILVEAFTAVRSGALMRRFQQDKLTRAILAGFVVNAAVAITLAANGAGAYSFAWGQVSAAVVTGAIVFWSARLPLRVGMDRAIAGRLLRFGLPSAAGTGLEAVLLNVGYIIVGDVLGPVLLGYYLVAFNVSSWVPGLIGTAIRYVSIPSFSRLAEREDDTLSRGVQQAVPLLVIGVLPIAILMGVLAHPLITLLYTDKWQMSAGVLRFLAVVMVVRMLTALAIDILTSQGATKSTVWMNLGHAVALIPAIVAGAHVGGIRGAAAGQAIAAIAVALPLAVLALRRTGVELLPIVPALRRPLLGGAASCATMLALSHMVGEHPLVQLCVAGGTGLLVFVLIAVPRALLLDLSGRMGVRVPARFTGATK